MKNTAQMIFVSCPNLEVARNICNFLVEARLVACGQIFTSPYESIYWWEDQIENAKEYLVLLKTRADLWEQVRDQIQALHPFEVPEILSIPIQEGLPVYMEWLFKETKS